MSAQLLDAGTRGGSLRQGGAASPAAALVQALPCSMYLLDPRSVHVMCISVGACIKHKMWPSCVSVDSKRYADWNQQAQTDNACWQSSQL